MNKATNHTTRRRRRRRLNARGWLVLVVMPLCIALLIIGRCATDHTTVDKLIRDDSRIVAAAERDARAVVDAPQGSMRREDAVLAIRARESRMRASGYDREADRYVAAAARFMHRHGIDIGR